MTNIRKLQDIQVGNEELLNTYRNYFSNGYINAAHNLINTNTLKSYVLQAEWMNAIKTKIENIEEPKDIEIDQELANKNAEFQYNIDELCYLQQYRTDVQYYKNNFVLYNNMVYFCIKNCKGIPPTFTSYWINVGLIGKKGQYGLGVTYKGFWDENTSYNKYDLVSYQNNLYIATNNNSGSIPNQYEKYLNDDLYLNNTLHLGYVETNQNWLLLTRVRPQPIYIFPSDYTQLPSHSIFFKELSYSIPSSPVSISGNIISINNALPSPVVDLTVGIEPVQDLHGYDNPWPAGGGKNLLPLTVDGIKSVNTSGTWNNNTYTYRDITWDILTDNSNNVIGIKANGTATAHSNFNLFTTSSLSELQSCFGTNLIKLSGCPANGSSYTYYLRLKSTSFSKTDVGSGINIDLSTAATDEAYRIFCNVDNGNTVTNLIFYPTIYLASETNDAFEPYSNICPISGWTGMNVQRTGKNLLGISDFSITGSGISYSYNSTTNVLAFSGTPTSASGYNVGIINIPINGTYNLSGKYTITGAGIQIILRKKSTNANVLSINPTVPSKSAILESGEYYIRVAGVTNNVQTSGTVSDIQLELGSTATPYEPYTGTTYPISWQTEAGTVYGGSLDVTTGVLTVDWRSVALTGAEAEGWRIGNTGTANWYYITANGILTSLAKNNSDNIKTNLYPWANVVNASTYNGFWGSTGVGSLRVRWGTEDTIANWRSFLASNPLHVVYKTSEPITYQLTPTEVTTLFRNNNLWADTSNIELTYLANIKA